MRCLFWLLQSLDLPSFMKFGWQDLPLASQQKLPRDVFSPVLLSSCPYPVSKSLLFSFLLLRLRTPKSLGPERPWAWIFRQKWAVFTTIFQKTMKSFSPTQYFQDPAPIPDHMFSKFHLEREVVDGYEVLST